MLSKRQREILTNGEEISDEYKAVLKTRIELKVRTAIKDMILITEKPDQLIPSYYPNGSTYQRKELIKDIFSWSDIEKLQKIVKLL